MEQTELLWQYQKEDLAADAFETEIKHNPVRVALIKNRSFLQEQQSAVERMKQEVAEVTDRLEVIKLAMAHLEEQIVALTKKLNDNPPETLAQAQDMTKEGNRLMKDLGDYEIEMKRIHKEAEDREKAEREARHKFAKVKQEYDKQKAEYEELSKQSTGELEAKRAALAEKSAKLDSVLLQKYLMIKKHCTPPVAKLNGDQCSGCNMSLPQVTLRKFKNDVPYIECENCGRLIIQ